MVLGMEIGLSPGDFVLHRGPPLPKKGGGAPLPNFGPRLLWPNGCIHQDALGMEIGLGLADIVLDEDPATPLLKGHSPQFSANIRMDIESPMTLVAKRRD